MKKAKVIPVHTIWDTNLPTSRLLQFSELLEKFFVHRLDKFIEKHNLLSDRQYGFRAKRSTLMAVMEIFTAKVNKECTVGVFIDLKKVDIPKKGL